MGIFDRLFGKLTPDRFAKMVQDAIRAAGETRPLQYDPKEFSIRAGADDGNIFYLHNVWPQYQSYDKAQRKALMKIVVRTWFSADKKRAPDDYEDLGPDLLPVIRARAYYELAELQFRREKPDAAPDMQIPYEIIADDLALAVVYDTPESMASINGEQLAKWNVQLYEALEKARQNLREREHQIAQIGDGLFASVSGDSYDASRIILLDLIRKLEVKGDAIAMIPNRDTLLIAGSEDTVSLGMMIELAVKAIEQRPLTGMALRLDGDDWQPWLPPVEHAFFRRFQELRIQSIGQEYHQQKELLEALHEKTGDDVFVATFSGLENKDGLTTYCAWTKGVPTLLPKSELIALVHPNEEMPPLFVPWQAVAEIAGDLMTPTDLYPSRYRVDEFPSAEQLKQLQKSATKRPQ